MKLSMEQERITVECVPSAAGAIFGGGFLPRRVSAQGNVCLGRGCLPREVSV